MYALLVVVVVFLIFFVFAREKPHFVGIEAPARPKVKGSLNIIPTRERANVYEGASSSYDKVSGIPKNPTF